jgi:drug/metabolite transporter (DMT)-like permease
MRQHIGSTLALVGGVLGVIAGFAYPGDMLIAGVFAILGALACRSAKRRALGEVKSTWMRLLGEAALILLILAAILPHDHLDYLIKTHPLPYLVVPLWALIAYAVAAYRARKAKHGEARASNESSGTIRP